MSEGDIKLENDRLCEAAYPTEVSRIGHGEDETGTVGIYRPSPSFAITNQRTSFLSRFVSLPRIGR